MVHCSDAGMADDEARWKALAAKLGHTRLSPGDQGAAWVELIKKPIQEAERVFLAPDVDQALLKLLPGEEVLSSSDTATCAACCQHTGWMCLSCVPCCSLTPTGSNTISAQFELCSVGYC